MAEYVNVAVDAMGGDNAPTEIVKGAVEAVNADKRVKVFLVGKEPVIREELKAYTYDAEQLEVVHAEEVIETAEPPVMAIRRKKDSSIVKAMYMVKNGECDAFVSAGSTGAVLVGGQVIVGRIRGVERPPLAPLIPTEKGVSLLLDCGANVDARPSMLVQFAKMGSVYMSLECRLHKKCTHFTAKRGHHPLLHLMQKCGAYAFIHLQDHIAYKRFTDNDICCTCRNISRFHTPDEIDLGTIL